MVFQSRGEENTLADARACFFLYCHGPVPRLKPSQYSKQDRVRQLVLEKFVNDWKSSIDIMNNAFLKFDVNFFAKQLLSFSSNLPVLESKVSMAFIL
jgi:hypothetical protein